MKKRMSALLLALLLCGSLAACGSSENEADGGNADPGVPAQPSDTVVDQNTVDPETTTPTDEQQTVAPTDEPQSNPSAQQTTQTQQSAPSAGGAASGGTAAGTNSSSASSGGAQTAAPAPAPEPESAPAPAPSAPTAAQASGYVGSSASALESALGAPSSKSYAPSCMGEGEDGIWSYSGFTVYTYRENGVETVEAVQ